MKKNNTGKYLKYAIGEIILVVIGILIALSINNWNETRKEKLALDTIYEMIMNDLKNDVIEGNIILAGYSKFSPYYVKFLNRTFTEKDYDECKCDNMLTGFNDMFFNKRGFELLEQTNNELIMNSALPDKILNFYNKYLSQFGLIEETLNEYLHDHTKKWSEKEWWSDYNSGIDDTGFRDYLVNDKNAQNHTSNFSVVLTRIYFPQISKFVADAEELITEIENR